MVLLEMEALVEENGALNLGYEVLGLSMGFSWCLWVSKK